MNEISLPRTRLFLEDGVLKKMSNTGAVISSFPLEDIHEVKVIEKMDFAVPLVIIIPSVALAFVCKIFINNPGWSWTGAIVCVAVAGFGFLTAKCIYIEVATKNGSVRYPVSDQVEEANGFVMTLQNKICD